jgi:hypothetical protein
VVSSTSSVSRAFTKSAKTTARLFSKAAAELIVVTADTAFRVEISVIRTLPYRLYFVAQKQNMSMPFRRFF